MATAASRSRVWLAGGAAVVVWGAAWTAIAITRQSPSAAPVALAAAFDFVVTANVALWWFGGRGRDVVPRWMFGATLAIGLVFARLAIAGARGGGLAIAVTGGALELALVVAAALRFRRASVAFRAARAAGERGFAALVAALDATRMPRAVASVIATELYVLAMAIAGWPGPAPDAARAFTVHRASGFTLYAGVFVFLILAETPAVHIALSIASPTGAWIATAASVYSVLWLAGYANAVRHGGVMVTATQLELRIGVRWRGRIPRREIASIEVCEAAPADTLDCSVMGANTVVTFTRPVRIVGLFGRVREATAIALSLDDRAGFQLALAEPLTRA